MRPTGLPGSACAEPVFPGPPARSACLRGRGPRHDPKAPTAEVFGRVGAKGPYTTLIRQGLAIGPTAGVRRSLCDHNPPTVGGGPGIGRDPPGSTGPDQDGPRRLGSSAGSRRGPLLPPDTPRPAPAPGEASAPAPGDARAAPGDARSPLRLLPRPWIHEGRHLAVVPLQQLGFAALVDPGEGAVVDPVPGIEVPALLAHLDPSGHVGVSERQ